MEQCSSVTSFLFFPLRGAPPLEGGGAPQRTTSDSLRVLPASSIASARANFGSRAKMPSKKVRRARLPRDPRRFRPPTALLVGHTWSATHPPVSAGAVSQSCTSCVSFFCPSAAGDFDRSAAERTSVGLGDPPRCGPQAWNRRTSHRAQMTYSLYLSAHRHNPRLLGIKGGVAHIPCRYL